MTMAERLVNQPFKTIIITEAKPLPEGTLINGMHVAPLPYQKIQEAQSIAEQFPTCICHIDGDHQYCVKTDGVEIPDEVQVESSAISVSPDNSIPPLGFLVKDPVIATTLMEDAALKHLTQLEQAHVHTEDIDKRLNNFVSEIEDVSQRLQTPGASKRARHEAIRFIKHAELTGPAIASAVVFAVNKITS